MTTTTQLAQSIVAALEMRAKAKPHSAADNPLGGHSLTHLTHGRGVRKSADHHPAQNMAEHGDLAQQMEAARITGLKEGRADRSTKRVRAFRARAARKAQFDRIADTPVKPNPDRMRQAWYVVYPMVPIVTRIADSKKSWASRFLGSNVDDVAQMALERMALVLAKSDQDLDLLRTAAEELGGMAQRSGKVPGDQVSEDERAERKALAKARKWLMGMANNRVMGALVDSYTDQRNLRWDNIDIIATVMASISGVGEDPLLATSKADRAPALLGASFPRPGGVDASLLSAGIAAAITDRRLDAMVEILLHEDNRRSDGAVRWADVAEALFLATPEHGAWMWDLVARATQGHANPRAARADAARTHVRKTFAFLPGLIVDLVGAFDQQMIGYSPTGHRAVLASPFELFHLGGTDPLGEHREQLRPALTFASSAEAAEALGECLVLLTSADLVRSAVHA